LATFSNCFWQAEHLLCQQVLLLYMQPSLAAAAVVKVVLVKNKDKRVGLVLFKQF
jgi:hypothetical protein